MRLPWSPIARRLRSLNVFATLRSKMGMHTPPRRDNQQTRPHSNQSPSTACWLFGVLVVLSGTVAAVGGASERPKPVASSSVLAQTNAPKSLWGQIVMVGASVSAGFTESEPFGGPKTSQYRLSRYVDAALLVPHGPVRNLGSSLLFLQTEELARQQIEQAVKAQPTLVIGIDFLFWFCYGEGGTDEERLRRFEKGLKLVEAIKCPLILGDIPDASAAVNGMLRPDQIPSSQAMAAANRRLKAWAASRKQVVIVRLSDFMRAATANQALTIRGHRWREGTTRAFLQKDRLHPSPLGCTAIVLAALDALLSTRSDVPAGEVCWDPEEVLRRGSQLRQEPASRPAKPAAPAVPGR